MMVALAIGPSALCAPSGLNVIPTADVLDQGGISLEAESAGSGRPWSDNCDQFALLQVGVGKGLEIGLDRCLNDSGSWLNVKWQAHQERSGAPGLAFGVQSISAGDKAQPYVVAMRSFGATRIHAGAARMGGRPRWMLGVDRPLGHRVTLQADYISGDENALTYGVAAALTRHLSLTVALSAGNSADAGKGSIINLAWSAY